MPVDPDEMLQSFAARVDEQTQRALQLSAALETAAVTVRTDGGEVTVRVDSAGGLADLHFHAEADDLSRNDLARLVVATSRRAQARLAEQVSALVSGAYGSDSGTAEMITNAYRSRYSTSDSDEGQR